jgi:ribonucleoside-triphosphate reductase
MPTTTTTINQIEQEEGKKNKKVVDRSAGLHDLAQLTFLSHYSRLEFDGTFETWTHAVHRVFAMHRTKIGPEAEHKLAGLIDRAEALCVAKRVFPSGRSLQFGGEAILKNHSKIYNCYTSFVSYPKVFQQSMWLLLCGGGTGVSVQEHHVAMLPGIITPPKTDAVIHCIDDSIEGWADALGVLMSTYFVANQPFPAYAYKSVVFDYSAIRPQGAFIRNIGTKAPGPDPLRKALDLVRKLLDERLAAGATTLRPIDCSDIITISADGVLSGGIRRSATLMEFSASDDEMLNAKTGAWYQEHAHRGRANISVVLSKDEVDAKVLARYSETAKQFGEPGVIMVAESARAEHAGFDGIVRSGFDVGYNPCVEIGMYPVSPTGVHTWSACNLSEINMAALETEVDFLAACEAVAVIGTLQASYTDMSYLGPEAEACLRREALLGCSMTGIQEKRHLCVDNPALLECGALVVKETNSRVAGVLGINDAARSLCVKPSGTASCVLECSGSGIHMPHAETYVRRVQFDDGDPTLEHYRKYRPDAITKGAWGNKWSVALPIQLDPSVPTKVTTGAIDLLADVRTLQKHWVLPGTNRELCVKPYLTHNVSLTVNIKDDEEWAAVPIYIAEHKDDFCGITMLGSSGDYDYAQAPFQAIPTASELVTMYGTAALFASGLIVHCNDVFESVHTACDAVKFGLHPLVGSSLDIKAKQQERELIVARVNKFAEKHCDGDVKATILLLKMVDAMHYHQKLVRGSSTAVPWDKLCLEQDQIEEQRAARQRRKETTPVCSGGSCVLESL